MSCKLQDYLVADVFVMHCIALYFIICSNKNHIKKPSFGSEL